MPADRRGGVSTNGDYGRQTAEWTVGVTVNEWRNESTNQTADRGRQTAEWTVGADRQRMGNESTNVDRARMGFPACGGMPSTNGGTHIRLLVKKFVDDMA
jgi:hypothetical protein